MDDSYFLKHLAIDSGTSAVNGFINVYTTLQQLMDTAVAAPDAIGPDIVTALGRILTDRTFHHQRQVYFYYLQTADILVHTALHHPRPALADAALQTLQNTLYFADGAARKAVADSLSHLPVAVRGPKIEPLQSTDVPAVDWRALVAMHDLVPRGPSEMFGRSVVCKLNAPDEHSLLVFKLLRKVEAVSTLIEEARWLQFLSSTDIDVHCRFDIPRLIRFQDLSLFRLHNLNINGKGLHPQCYAIAFMAPESYFFYPNMPDGSSPENFREIMARSARLLGILSGLGIVHTAPIPLFHNRIQAHRRTDRGFYEWNRAGRLDRWLTSCDYPNLGPTGIRDFEHFISFDGSSRQLFRYLGNHLLGLILVSGSYFRNRERKKQGRTSNGEPVDVRYLFDPLLFRRVLADIFDCYYEGFTGNPPPQSFPYEPEYLITRLIDEMGIDRHMTEVLRVVDQKAMSADEFDDFLNLHGIKAHKHKQGAGDIEVSTGPHLGAFNRGISAPELIATVSAVTAVCMVDRYRAVISRRSPPLGSVAQ